MGQIPVAPGSQARQPLGQPGSLTDNNPEVLRASETCLQSTDTEGWLVTAPPSGRCPGARQGRKGVAQPA